MNKFRQFIYRFANEFILILGGLLLFTLSLFSLVFQAEGITDGREAILVHRNGFLFLGAIIIFIFLLFISRKYINKISEKKLFYIFVGIYIIAGMYLIFNVDAMIRHDARDVLSLAEYFRSGKPFFDGIKEYVYMYSHQLGLATFERLFLWFSSNGQFFFFLNLIMILISNFFQWKITDLLFDKNSMVNKYAIIFTFVLLPNLFLILFVYGLIPGFLFLSMGIYFLIRNYKEDKKYHWIYAIVFIMLACGIRNNYIIGAISTFIILVLEAIRKKKLQPIIVALIIVMLASQIGNVFIKCYRLTSDEIIGDGMPKILWVAMGLQDDENTPTAGGWYNGYNARIYRQSDYNNEVATDIAKQNIKDRLEYFKDNPKEAAVFFSKKITTTWCDPLFHSIWTGPQEVFEQYTHTRVLKSIYNGGTLHGILQRGMSVIIFVIYFMALCYIVIKRYILKKEISLFELIPILFILGTFLFHLFWETKSQYVFPAVIMLVPISAMGFELLSVQVNKLIGKIK